MSKYAGLAALARNSHRWIILIAAALTSFLLARLTILVPIGGGLGNVMTVIWAPTAAAFALAWYFGWIAVVGASLGSFLFNYWISGGHLIFSIVAGIGNALPAAFASWYLHRLETKDVFGVPRNVLRFAIFAVMVAPLFSSSAGVLAAWLDPSPPLTATLSTWIAFWIGDALAMLLIAPALLTLNDWRTLSWRGYAELLAMVVAAGIFFWKLFLEHPEWQASPLAILTMPLLILAIFRYRFGIVAGIGLMLTLLVLAGSSHAIYGSGPQGFFFATTYLATLGVTILAVAAGSAVFRAAANRVAASEVRLRAMFEQAGVGFMLYDVATAQRTFNQKFLDMLGYATDELPPDDLRDISFADEHRVTFDLIKRLQRGEITSANQEKRYIRKQGDIIWVSLTMSMLRDKEGVANYFIGVFEDITARKRAELQIEGQSRILHALTTGASLPELLEKLALFAEELWPRSHCAIYLADNDNGTLYFGAAPNMPDRPSHPEQIPIIDGLASTPTAAARKRTVISTDTLSDPMWQALPNFVAKDWQRACWATPFLTTSEELLGVITLYFPQVSAPSPQDNDLIGMLSSLAGIVLQRHRDAERLRDSEQRFRLTFEQAAVGVALFDRNSRWIQVNQKYCEIVGYTFAELQELHYSATMVSDDPALLTDTITSLLRGDIDTMQLEHRLRRKNGDIIWVWTQTTTVFDQDGQVSYYILVVEDITERKRAEAEVERLALYDSLTALPNRRLFGDRLRTALAAARRSGQCGALIYIDLDNFKQLNDAHGHNVGDDFLKMVAHRLQRSLREQDTVARLGGDEFVVLLQNLGNSLPAAETATTAIAEKIQSALREVFILPSGVEYTVTSSLGVTLFPRDHESAEELLKEADIAMYRVKESQRNAIRFYEPAMKAEVDSRLALERALRNALRDEEFELYLQPQYDAENHIVSCEALLRWPQRDGTFVPPNEFIPIAEETGLIVPLGEWVLRAAGNLVTALELAGYDTSIAVNVSPRQFSEPNFVERVRTIFWETGADSGRIVLEITEGVVVADFDDVRAKIMALRAMGIRLSIDDFGTGHSSLAYLKLLPLHELKIDRAFISYLPGDANDAAIVEAILSVARHLQLDVVAEGVETADQMEFLKQRGCDRFQGFYLARPAPPQQHFPNLAQ